MAGVQIAGLVSGLDWTSIISEIIQADSASMNQVKAQQTTVNNQNAGLGTLGTDLTNVENSIFTLEDPGTFSAVTAGSTAGDSTWQVNATSGTAIGNTDIDVTNLATASKLTGHGGISQSLNPTDDVSSTTLANLGLADPITAGNFSVNGAQITVTTSESLQDVFTAIATATGGNVTAAYDAGTDKVTLTAATGTVSLGADNDTSNFLQSMKLANNEESSVASSGPLGALKTGVPLSSAGLSTSLTGLDGSGNGSFTVNGVSISYNADTDSLSTLLDKINNSTAGVTAIYDSANNRILLANTDTGDTGIGVSDVQGNLAASLGLTVGSGSTLSYGENAVFSVNGGPPQTSASNALTAAQLGVPGLNVTVNSTDDETIAVVADTSTMQTAIQSFITAFNQLQTDITNDTQITTNSSGSVTTSLLSSTHEVGDWGSQLQMTAFSAGSGLSGAINSLDSLGIDFNGTTGQLEISDSAQLQQALSSNPTAVAAFFQTARTGFGSIMNSAINDIIGQNTAEQSSLQSESTDLGNQITTMQTQLNAQQQQLETEFTNLEAMEEQYQNEEASLNSLNSGSSGSSGSTLSSTTPTVNIPGSSSSSSSSGSSSSSSSTGGTSGTTA